jgi:hypothetical protein
MIQRVKIQSFPFFCHGSRCLGCIQEHDVDIYSTTGGGLIQGRLPSPHNIQQTQHLQSILLQSSDFMPNPAASGSDGGLEIGVVILPPTGAETSGCEWKW